MEILGEEEGFHNFRLALKDDRVEQCLRSCGSEFQMWGPKQENVRCVIECDVLLVANAEFQEQDGCSQIS